MTTKNVSPLRYPGGKTRACKILDKIVIDNINIKNINKIISPFFGGGSFEFHMQNKYNIDIVANDKFHPLYCFWNQCKINKDELCTRLYNEPKIKKDIFTNYRNTIINTTNDIDMAVKYFVINRCSFSGATLSGGFSEEASVKRFTKSSIDRVNNLNLSNFTISNMDFSDFIENNNDGLIFLDPPYYLEKQSKLYGNNGDMHESFNHEQLYETIKDYDQWIMTYNNCDYIKELYSDYTIIDAEWSYGMNKSKKSSEIVILNC